MSSPGSPAWGYNIHYCAVYLLLTCCIYRRAMRWLCYGGGAAAAAAALVSCGPPLRVAYKCQWLPLVSPSHVSYQSFSPRSPDPATMIIEKSNGLLDQVQTPLEPPPDYETASRIPERGPSTPTPSYSPSRPPRPTASSSSPPQPRSSDARHHAPPLQPQLEGGKRWFGLFGGHTAQEKETRSTVVGLVGALLQQPYDDASVSILDSCAEACADQGIVFSSLLQERSFEGRTPLYWAIVKLAGPNSDTASSGERALVLSLLAHCAPLLPNTRSEITLACVAASDNALYQTFRAMPEFGTVAGADRMLLGLDVSPPLDRAVVEEVLDEPLLFVVNFQFSHFQRRMRAGGKVGCSFIARGMTI